MNLLKYYKLKAYELGYHQAKRDIEYNTNHSNPVDDIYFNDEMDFNICVDYYGIYVGDEANWTQDDIDFLEVLGFGTGDFEED